MSTQENPSTATAPAPPRRMAPVWLRLLLLAGVGLALVLPLLGLDAWSWLSGQSRAVRTTAADYLDAAHKNDFKTARELVVAQARQGNPLGPVFSFPGLQMPFTLCQVGRVTINGHEAKAQFFVIFNPGEETPAEFPPQFREQLLEQARRQEGKEGELSLEWEDGRWLVRGVAPAASPEEHPRFVDFTDAGPAANYLKDASRMVAEHNRPAFDALAPLDAGQFEAAWRVDCVAQDRPAREVLEQMLGLKVAPFAASPASLGKRVSLNVQGKSRLEVAEEVCRLLGMHPDYTAVGLRVQPGARTLPVAFAGPFLIKVMAVEEYPAYARGTLTLECSATGLPRALLEKRPEGTFRLEGLKITGPGGRNLLHGGKADLAFSPPPIYQGADPVTTVVPARLPLRNLLADMNAIPLVKGRVGVTLPEVDVFRFGPLRQGAGEGDKRMRWALRQAAPQSVTFDASGVAGRRLLWMAYDSTGKAVHFGDTPLPRDGPQRLDMPEGVDSLVLKVVGGKGTKLGYDFEIRDIPLKQRPPLRLEPARFPGKEAPASAKVLDQGMTTGRVQFQVSNDCQKDIEKVTLKLTYRDATGKVLREDERIAPDTIAGNASPRLLVAAGSNTSLVLTVPSAPAGAARLVARVTGVEFMDATAWPPPK